MPSLILIVDDMPAGRKTLEALLTSPDYQLAFACNGLEALAKALELTPDLILLDVMMPDMDGFEVCRRLRAEKRGQHIPIILVTALDSKEDLAEGLEAGADDFLSKPINSLELRARVRSMLRIRKQYAALENQQQELETSLSLNQKFAQAFAQHLEVLEVLHETGLNLMNTLEIDLIVDFIFQTTLELIPETMGCIIHFLTEEEQLIPVLFSREDNAKMVYPSLGIEKLINQVIETGKPAQISKKVSDLYQLPPDLADLQTLLATPLLSSQQVLGTLSVYSSKAGAFETNHNYILSILANQASVAITKARLIKETERAQRREKEAIRNMFQRYVSPAVVERLIDGREGLVLGGKRQEISLMFADIRGFSTFSEKLPPENVIDTLNQYLALAVEAILAEEGTLDKFVGDAVMALFNAPLPQPDHTLRAVRAALAMQQAISNYNRNLNAQPLSFGIGIHVGQAVVGNVGTVKQMNYTAIGDTINLAKRLQENAKGGQILLSEAACKAVKDKITVKDLGFLTVKGRIAREHIYELTGLA